MDLIHEQFILFIATFIISALGIFIFIPLLTHFKMLDRPNYRSSHSMPIPRGGGIAIIISSILIPSFFQVNWPNIVICIATIFTLFSLIDDIKGINPFIRFIIHILLVLIFFFFSPWKDNITIFSNKLPFYLDIIISIIALLWFINLFNFMDGIDGITGIECIILSIGATLVCFFNDQDINLPYVAIAGSGLAFLLFNWHPAKVFLGDSGSISLGFINGFILLDLTTKDLFPAALILSSYYLSDSSLTLIKRIANRQKPWRAHNDHFYQKAVQKGLSHSSVSTMVALHGIILIILAIITGKIFPTWAGFLLTGIWCLLFLYFLSTGFGKAKNVFE